MTTIIRSLITVICITLIGCYLPKIIQPLRLYDLASGRTIEVVAHQTSADHGILSSSAKQKRLYHGEYIFLGRSYAISRPTPVTHEQAEAILRDSGIIDLAQLYGYGKNSPAQPVGTGILIGPDSTVVQLVFYRVSPDLQEGDGVGKDNKCRYYRIFLSTEEY